jgi:hypothetical protein
MSLFDSPNDMQWQQQIHGFKRSSNETLIGKIVDERADGNYLDNMFQKYTVELLGWGQRLYNCKVRIPNAGYNGTGKHVSFKNGDGVLIQCKEGQLDDAIIIGAHRLNGNFNQLEVKGQAEKFGEHPKGSRGTTAAASAPSLHPGRVTKLDSEIFIGGVNNAQTPYEDPTEVGTLEESLNKQPIPGIYKSFTKEGVDVNYCYGGILNMTDGNYVVMSSGTTQNKCTKYLEQASRHSRISSHLNKLTTFVGGSVGLLAGKITENLDEDLSSFDNSENKINNLKNSPLKNPVTGEPLNTETNDTDNNNKLKQRGTQSSTEDLNKNQGTEEGQKEVVEKEDYVLKAGSNVYRAYKHDQLANIAKTQAEECNSNNAAFQYSALLMGNASATLSTSSSSPNQGVGHVDPNNFSSRNTANPKPPTEFVGCHPNNYSSETHTLKYLVMHHSVASMEGTINTFNDPIRKASAQYAVGKDGRVVQFVKDNEKAYHVAGQNTGKIGIEIIATKPNEGMTKEQEEALIKLSRYIMSTYKIPIENVRGHNSFMATECPTWIFPTQEKLTEWANKYLKV